MIWKNGSNIGYHVLIVLTLGVCFSLDASVQRNQNNSNIIGHHPFVFCHIDDFLADLLGGLLHDIHF